MSLLHKIFKFEGGTIAAGPKKGETSPDSWMWTSWLMGSDENEDPYWCLYYTFDKKMITQTADKQLLTNKRVHIVKPAKLSEVPEEFLKEIIVHEWRKQ